PARRRKSGHGRHLRIGAGCVVRVLSDASSHLRKLRRVVIRAKLPLAKRTATQSKDLYSTTAAVPMREASPRSRKRVSTTMAAHPRLCGRDPSTPRLLRVREAAATLGMTERGS